MSVRGLATSLLVVGLLQPCVVLAADRPSAGFYGTAGGFFGDASEEWNGALGFGLTGSIPLAPHLDLRGDVGGRWFDGDGESQTVVRRDPHWGGRTGENATGLRLLPVTVSVVHRAEAWSKGRAWLPYVGAGAGFYDGVATYRLAGDHENSGQTDVERTAATFRPGLHLLGGARFERTTGMFLTLEAAFHAIDTPGQWSTYAEIALGVGAFLPRR